MWRHRASCWGRGKHNYNIYCLKKFSVKITYNKKKLDVNLGTAHRDGAEVRSSSDDGTCGLLRFKLNFPLVSGFMAPSGQFPLVAVGMRCISLKGGFTFSWLWPYSAPKEGLWVSFHLISFSHCSNQLTVQTSFPLKNQYLIHNTNVYSLLSQDLGKFSHKLIRERKYESL